MRFIQTGAERLVMLIDESASYCVWRRLWTGLTHIHETLPVPTLNFSTEMRCSKVARFYTKIGQNLVKCLNRMKTTIYQLYFMLEVILTLSTARGKDGLIMGEITKKKTVVG